MKPGLNATRNFSRVVCLSQSGGGDPGVFAPRSGGCEHRFESEEFGGAGDLAEIGDGRWSDAARRGPDGEVGIVSGPDDFSAVAVGR